MHDSEKRGRDIAKLKTVIKEGSGTARMTKLFQFLFLSQADSYQSEEDEPLGIKRFWGSMTYFYD